MNKRKSIPSGIMDALKDKKEHSFGSIVSEVAKFYIHSKYPEYHGQQFINQRVGVALFRLIQDGKVVRVRHGYYKKL